MHTSSNKNNSWKPTEFTYELGIMGYVEKGQQSDLTMMLKIEEVLIQTLTKKLGNTRESYFTDIVWAFIFKSRDLMDGRMLTFNRLHRSQYDY